LFYSCLFFLLIISPPRSFFTMPPPPPTSTLFPYTTLFRSLLPALPASDSPAGRHMLLSPPRSSSGQTPDLSTGACAAHPPDQASDRKSTRLNSSHVSISYAVFCLKKKKKTIQNRHNQHASN